MPSVKDAFDLRARRVALAIELVERRSRTQPLIVHGPRLPGERSLALLGWPGPGIMLPVPPRRRRRRR